MRKFIKVMKALGITFAVLATLAVFGAMLVLTKGLLVVLIIAACIFAVAYSGVA